MKETDRVRERERECVSSVGFSVPLYLVQQIWLWQDIGLISKGQINI